MSKTGPPCDFRFWASGFLDTPERAYRNCLRLIVHQSMATRSGDIPTVVPFSFSLLWI